LEPSSIRLPEKSRDKNIPLPFQFKFCPTTSDTQQEHNQHQQLLGDIDLLTCHQHPTSAQEQQLRDFDLLSWQQSPTFAPNTPNPWLVLTTRTLKADKTAVAKVKARETTSLALTKDQVHKMLGEYVNLSFLLTST
jgi:hypothetical protein